MIRCCWKEEEVVFVIPVIGDVRECNVLTDNLRFTAPTAWQNASQLQYLDLSIVPSRLSRTSTHFPPNPIKTTTTWPRSRRLRFNLRQQTYRPRLPHKLEKLSGGQQSALAKSSLQTSASHQLLPNHHNPTLRPRTHRLTIAHKGRA